MGRSHAPRYHPRFCRTIVQEQTLCCSVTGTPVSAYQPQPSAKPLVSELRRETIPGRLQPAAPLSAGGQNLARTLSVNMFDAFIIQAFAPDCKAFLAEGRRTRRKWRSGGMVYDERK